MPWRTVAGSIGGYLCVTRQAKSRAELDRRGKSAPSHAAVQLADKHYAASGRRHRRVR